MKHLFSKPKIIVMNEKAKQNSLQVAREIVRLRQIFYPTTFGTLNVKYTKGVKLEIFQNSSTANYADDVVAIVNAIPGVSFWLKYDTITERYIYHIY